MTSKEIMDRELAQFLGPIVEAGPPASVVKMCKSSFLVGMIVGCLFHKFGIIVDADDFVDTCAAELVLMDGGRN